MSYLCVKNERENQFAFYNFCNLKSCIYLEIRKICSNKIKYVIYLIMILSFGSIQLYTIYFHLKNNNKRNY